jgi:hypothetical protein
MPNPYLTKQRVLKAAETAGAPRGKIKEDTEAWRFYPIVERSRRLGEERGMRDAVSSTIVIDDDKRSRPLVTSSDRIVRAATRL